MIVQVNASRNATTRKTMGAAVIPKKAGLRNVASASARRRRMGCSRKDTMMGVVGPFVP